jgi:soluble lytic murein transglycosylase-like protein
MYTIPVVAIVLFFMFSHGENSPSSQNISAQNIAPQNVVLQQVSFDDHPPKHVWVEEVSSRDAQAIFGYITATYRKIPEEEAKAISSALIESAQELKIDPLFIAALMSRESSFNRMAVSRTGAKGLGQIKDFNYPSLGITDPFDIIQNTRGTMTYIKKMLGRWDSESAQTSLALASYFKGYGAVSRANKMVDVQTKKYVEDILATYDKLKEYKTTL